MSTGANFQQRLWRVTRQDNNNYEFIVSGTKPTTTSGGDPILPAQTTIINDLFFESGNTGYVFLQSALSDNKAVQINASNPNGGIEITSNFGGTNITSTNSIQLNGGAACEFRTSNGNLELQAQAGLCNIDGLAGINVGNTGGVYLKSKTGVNIDTTNAPISLDASGADCNFTLNANDAQTLAIAVLGHTGGKLHLLSQGTQDNSIRIESLGGLDYDGQGPINFATASPTSGAITLDAFFGGGGIVLSSGAQGIAINSNGGALGIGHFSGGDMFIGTAGVARAILLGNNTAGTYQIHRWDYTKIEHQGFEFALGDADALLTIGQLFTQILTIPPTAARTLTLPTAASIIAGVSIFQVNDSFDFHIINTGSDTATLAANTGNTIVGSAVVGAGSSAHFRVRITNLASSCTIYRLA